MSDRLLRMALRFRWLGLTVILVGFLAGLSGLPRLTITADGRVFFGPDNPHLQSLQRLENTFTPTHTVLIAVGRRDRDLFNREDLTTLYQLTQAAWQIPYTRRVDSLTNYLHSRAETTTEGESLVVEALVTDPAALDAAAIERIRGIALGEPLLLNALVAPDGKMAGVNLTILLPDNNPAASQIITDAVRVLVATVDGRSPGLDVYLTGTVPLAVAFGEATINDMANLTPIILLVVTAISILMLRSLFAGLAILVQIVLTVGAALGLAGWAGVILNPGSGNATVIIVTIVVCYSIHLIAAVQARMRQGMPKGRAVQEASVANLHALFVSALTTVIGCLSMNSSDAPPFRDLGNITALGAFLGFLSTVTVLPFLLWLLPVGAPKTRASALSGWEARLAEVIVRRPAAILTAITLTAIVAGVGITRITLDDDFVHSFSEAFTYRVHTDQVTARLTGAEQIEFMLDSGRPDGVHDPAFLTQADRFVTWLRRQPEIINAYALTDVLKRLNKNMNQDDPAFYRLPDDAVSVAQFLLLYELSLPPGLDLTDRIDIDRRLTRISAVGRDLTSREIREFLDRAAAWRAVETPLLTAVTASGMAVMYAYVSEINIHSMLVGTALSLLVVSLILILTLRDPFISAWSLVSNYVPAVIAFGLWGHLVGEVGMAVSVVAAMTFGIVVDDTVHLLEKYIHARRTLGLSPEDSIRHSIRIVGQGVLAATVVLVAGFSVLATSGYDVTGYLGLLAATVIGVALFGDLFILMPVLLLTDRWRTRSRDPVRTPETVSS